LQIQSGPPPRPEDLECPGDIFPGYRLTIPENPSDLFVLSRHPERNRILVPLLLSWGSHITRFDIESCWEDLQDNRFDPKPANGDDGDVLRMLKCVNQFACDYVETLTEGQPKETELQKERKMTVVAKERARTTESWQRNIVSRHGKGARVPFALKCDFWPIGETSRRFGREGAERLSH
jgi:hypothetical protein